MKDITFLELKKNSKRRWPNQKSERLAIIGDCSTQLLATAIKGEAYRRAYNIDMFDADYDQIDAQVIDEQSELYRFVPQYTVLFMCRERIYERFCATPLSERKNFADGYFAKIANYWSCINSHMDTKIIQFTFVEAEDGIFGDFAFKTPDSFPYQLAMLNRKLFVAATELKNLYLIDLNEIRADLGSSNFCDDRLYYIAKMPIATEALPIVAAGVVDWIAIFRGQIKKCVVVDLDNTIWGGVIGDDGMEGIQIGELGLGHAFSDLQRWLKELKNRGIILAVCSKNNEDTAKEPFKNHPEMILRLEDISIFVANWEDKASNIRYIQKTLNIGMDSMIFLDDNPFERNLVRSMIPDITVPELPADPAHYLTYLKQLRLFGTASYSLEDQHRTDQYRAEAGRAQLQASFNDFDSYLQNLDMVATVRPFDQFSFPRIAQLTQRSNQFNLRTIRYTEAEIAAIADNDHYLSLYFSLRDKLGDYGLISVVIMDKLSADELFISEWLMSCRVLKRGMEEFIINKIIHTAAANGFTRVIGEYIKTPKNAMVANLYAELGFKPIEDNKFVANIADFSYNKTYIKEE